MINTDDLLLDYRFYSVTGFICLIPGDRRFYQYKNGLVVLSLSSQNGFILMVIQKLGYRTTRVSREIIQIPIALQS